MHIRRHIRRQVRRRIGAGDRGTARRLTQFARRRTAGDQRHKHEADGRGRQPSHGIFPFLAMLLVFWPIHGSAATASAAPPNAVPSPRSDPLPSGVPVRLSLEDAVAIALRDNRAIRSAYLDRITEKFRLYVSERQFVPRGNITQDTFLDRSSGVSRSTVTITPNAEWRTPTGATVDFSWDRNYDTIRNAPTADQNRSTGLDLLSLTVTQPLLRGGGTAVNLAPIRIARLQERINQLRLQTTVSGTVTTVVLAYRSLSQAQEQERLTRAALDRTRQILDTNRLLIGAGRMAASDIVQSQAQVASQQVAVLQAGQQVRSAQLALLRLLAVDLRTNVVAADFTAVRHVDIDTERVVASGLSARMDILGQRLSVEQSRYALLLARNERLWDLSVVGNLNKARNLGPLEGAVDQRLNKSVRLSLEIPIGQPERRESEIDATVSLRQTELGYRELLQGAESEIRDAIQTVEASWLQLQVARQARDLAQQVLEIGREKLRAGRSSNFEMLSFDNDLRSADTQQLSASIAYLNALTTLDEQTGNTLETWKINLND